MNQILRRVTILTLVLASVISIRFPLQSRGNTDLSDAPYFATPLLPPPVKALNPCSAPPLNTSTISFLTYYRRLEGWNLSETIPAFIAYFDGGSYYEGYIRIWDSEVIGASSPDAHDTFIDVKVRVNEDGWIIAWLERDTHSPQAMIWWGHTRRDVGDPVSHSSSLSRAIEIVFHVAGVTFPGHESINVYDYSEPNATRLLIFGLSKYGDPPYENSYYYTIPPNSTLEPIKLLIEAGGGPTSGFSSELRVDGELIYSIDSGYEDWGWLNFEVRNVFSKGTQHAIDQYTVNNRKHHVAFLLWASGPIMEENALMHLNQIGFHFGWSPFPEDRYRPSPTMEVGPLTFLCLNGLKEPPSEVIPEFPSLLILPLFMIATLLAVIVYRKKLSMT